MVVLDHLLIINRQSELIRDLYSPNTKLTIMLHFAGLRKPKNSLVTRKLKRIYITLDIILHELNDLQAGLQLQVESLKDENIKILIEWLEHSVSIYASLETSLQKTAERDLQERFPIIKDCQSMTLKTLDVIYNTIRLLRRYSKTNPTETSILAFDSNARSLQSLKRIYHNSL